MRASPAAARSVEPGLNERVRTGEAWVGREWVRRVVLVLKM